MHLDTWDELDRPGRENAVGRRLSDGAPLTGGSEESPADLAAVNELGFPVIDAATAGGPVQATTTLIYKIYREGFAGLDLSASAAQSVVLMFLVIILTVVQFRYVESKVRYQ